MKIYISGALRGSRNLVEAREKYEGVAQSLAARGFSFYLPHQQTDPVWAEELDPVDVFRHDLRELLKCDLVLAFLDEASLGVGAEIVLAVQHAKPVVGAYKRECSLSRFISGFLMTSRQCVLLEYDHLEDLVQWIANSPAPTAPISCTVTSALL
jgi:nucleoside 2-deoxyribosyltransferase